MSKKNKSKTLPAIVLAEKILELVVDWTVSDEDIEEALEKLRISDTTWGLLWGNPTSRISRLDNDLYNLKKDVLDFIVKMRANDKIHLATMIKVTGESRVS